MTITTADITDAQRAEFATAVHESGHAVAVVLAGGTVDSARLLPAGAALAGRTMFRAAPDRARPGITYAGIYAEARWCAGRPPTGRELRSVLAASGVCDDADLLARNAGVLPRSVDRDLDNCWSAVVDLAAQIYVGPVGDAQVRAALGLSTDPDEAAMQLHRLRGYAASWPS